MKFRPGDTIDEKYEVISLLGSGGFGTVYLVKELQLNRTAALKILTRFSQTDEIQLKRFEREAQILSQMNHANIVSVHRFGWLGKEAPYLVLENVQGESLRDRLNREKNLICSEAVEIARQTAVALKYAYGHSVIHRDLKPENLLITSDDRDGIFVKLIDFGLSKQSGSLAETLTDTGAIFGTPNYMSPEHCLGKELTFQSDMYSLACVLYEMICGSPPFESENFPETILKQVSQTTPSLCTEPTQVSQDLDKLIAKCTNKNPNERFSDYDSLIEALSAETLLRCKEKISIKQTRAGKDNKKVAATQIILWLAAFCLIAGLITWFTFQKNTNKNQTAQDLLKSAQQECRGCSRVELEYLKFQKLHDGGFKLEATECALSALRLLMKSCKEKIEAKPASADLEIGGSEIEKMEKISSFLLSDTTGRLQWSRIYALLTERTKGDSTDDVTLKLRSAYKTLRLRVKATINKGSMNETLADEVVGYCWRLTELKDPNKKYYIDLAESLIQKYKLTRRDCELHLFLTDYYLEQNELKRAKEQFDKAKSLLKELKLAESDGIGYLDNELDRRARALERAQVSKVQ